MMHYRAALLLTLTALASTCTSTAVLANSGAAATAGTANNGQRDPFIAAAPLIVAAVCSDGVAMVACHVAFNDERLLLSKRDATTILHDRDLPRTYHGPFRMHVIDATGSCLMTCGWRADGDMLVDRCRSIAQRELQIFGASSAEVVGKQASLWMARCASSDRQRSLSAVAMMIEPDSVRSSSQLLFLDATGSYPMNALALGKGSEWINVQLSKTNFRCMRAEDGVKALLNMIAEDDVTKLGDETRFEVAVVQNRQMKRLFVSDLFGLAK